MPLCVSKLGLRHLELDRGPKCSLLRFRPLSLRRGTPSCGGLELRAHIIEEATHAPNLEPRIEFLAALRAGRAVLKHTRL